MKKILMLGTGGTIASKQMGNGLAPAITPEELLSYIPEVKNFCEVDTLQVCNIDSTNMNPEHWKLIVRALEENYERYDGFVICHGTDTLAYTAAALSYMVQNSRKPIVITGAQKPIDMDVTDAKTNLIDSFRYAADDASQNVNIVFGGKVIIGTRARKERAKSYNAFSSLNFPYPAVIQDGMIVRYLPEVPIQGLVQFSYEMNDKVYVLKLVPGMKPDILHYLFEQYDCLIIESYGVGGIPDSLVSVFYEEMNHWEGQGKYVVITTQVANEGSNMMVYEVGKKVKQDFDLIEAYDMTLESTITKMMWLLAKPHTNAEWVRNRFYTSINHDILFTTAVRK